MASISTDKNGNRRIQFIDRNGDRRAIRLGKLPKRDVEAIKTKIEALNAAAISGSSWSNETAEWVGSLQAPLHRKLAAVGLVARRAQAEQANLGAFLEAYTDLRSDVKESTKTVYGHSKRCLIKYFGADKPLTDITAGDCDAWRIWLSQDQGLAENTVKRRCAIAKQFFRSAQRRKLIPENPFADMKSCTTRGNRSRDFFVSREAADRVLEACPDAEWRLLFALSRFGGLRCPSEHLGLRWSDVDWEHRRFTVHSPKTAHHEGKASRLVPIFPELRPYLEDVFDSAETGTEFVITRYRNPTQNLRTQLERIIRKAGLKPWPKLFQNLRSTRQTELAEHFPAHAVCQWIGNSLAVAREHYLQVTDEHFEKAAHFQAQQAAVSPSGDSHQVESKMKNPEETLVSRGIVVPAMGGTGLEPVTSTV